MGIPQGRCERLTSRARTPIDLSALPRPVVTRYAPSPTGLLHLGHVANALYVWGVARAAGGSVVLRMEDHDRGRCRPEYETAILRDVEWLGFQPDIGLIEEFRSGTTPFRQSNNDGAYQRALGELEARGLVYGCACTRRDVQRAASAGSGVEPRYAGTCRHRGLGTGGAVRVVLGEGIETFRDLVHGPVDQVPDEQCGDMLVRDRHGNWTYQFAVAVDDLRQGVTLVVRGDDLLESTGRQVRLARLLGRPESPVYLHHPLVRDERGAKLSKRDGATGVRELRYAGRRPAYVLGRAAHLVGLLKRPQPLDAKDVGALFG